MESEQKVPLYLPPPFTAAQQNCVASHPACKQSPQWLHDCPTHVRDEVGGEEVQH